MRLQSVIAVVSAAVGQVAAQTGELGDAVAVKNNPPAPIYKATLPDKPFFTAGSLNGNVRGSITAVGTMGGEGVQFKVKFENLPKEGGPFTYHLHVDPVGDDGNCTKTLAHLDPYIRGEATPCDKNNTASCQVGDLSGKHGTITSDPFEATYVDAYAALVPGIGAYFGNRSFVIHFSNKTRISCANFKVVEGTHHDDPDCPTSTTSVPAGTGSLPGPTSTHSLVPFLGSAPTSSVPVSMLMVAVAAAMFAL